MNFVLFFRDNDIASLGAPEFPGIAIGNDKKIPLEPLSSFSLPVGQRTGVTACRTMAVETTATIRGTKRDLHV